MIVGIVEIKRLSADYISITTRNPAQVLDKACFNVAASTKVCLFFSSLFSPLLTSPLLNCVCAIVVFL